jgi:hypothetical protein
MKYTNMGNIHLGAGYSWIRPIPLKISLAHCTIDYFQKSQLHLNLIYCFKIVNDYTKHVRGLKCPTQTLDFSQNLSKLCFFFVWRQVTAKAWFLTFHLHSDSHKYTQSNQNVVFRVKTKRYCSFPTHKQENITMTETPSKHHVWVINKFDRGHHLNMSPVPLMIYMP